MKYTAVIFDWDGVLGMTLHLWLEGYRNELRKIGRDYSDRIIIDDFFYEHKTTALKYPDIDLNAFVPLVHDHMVSHIPSLKTYPGAHEMLKTLQRHNVARTLVSSSPRRLVKEELIITGLEQFISILVGGDDVLKHKPDPEPFLNILEMGKYKPESTIVLGDSHTDILAAHAAGIDSCLFVPKENELFHEFDKLKSTKPTYQVETLQEFSHLIIG